MLARKKVEQSEQALITLNSELEERVMRRTRELQLALEAGRMGTWHLDLQKDSSERSPLHDQIFGYAEPLPDWNYEKFVSHVLEEDREEVTTQFRQSLQTGRLYIECRIRRAGGEIRWIEERGHL